MVLMFGSLRRSCAEPSLKNVDAGYRFDLRNTASFSGVFDAYFTRLTNFEQEHRMLGCKFVCDHAKLETLSR